MGDEDKIFETPWSDEASGASDPNRPGAPEFRGHGSGSITWTIVANGNDPVVVYALRLMQDVACDGVYTLAGYVQADGTVGGAEVFRTAATWGYPAVSGLTDFRGYTLAAKAKNELGVESEYSVESAAANTLPDTDAGLTSDNLLRDRTAGDTKVVGVTIATALDISGTTVPEEVTPKYYGDVVFGYKLVNDDSEVSGIEPEFSEDGGATWAAAAKGSGGDGVTGLNSSPAGKTHTFVWDSYSDAGTSEYEEDVMFRIRALDGDGAAGAYLESALFTISNLPGKIVWEWEDGRTFGKDATPTVIAVIPYLRGGVKGFVEVSFSRSDGLTEIITYKSVASVAGWEYETAPGVWAAVTAAGIPSTVIDGRNRMRFTPPAELPVGSIIVTGKMSEWRDLG